MTTKAEQHAKDEQAAAAQHRMDARQAEQDRQTGLVNPLTHPSSGNPPAGVTPHGDRMGTVEEEAEKAPAKK